MKNDFEPVPDFDLSRLFQEQTEEEPPHPEKCKCRKCDPEGKRRRGGHPKGCMCDICVSKRPPEPPKISGRALEPVWGIVCGFLDNRLKEVKGWTPVTQKEIAYLSETTANLINKYMPAVFEYQEEMAFAGAILGVFGFRFFNVWMKNKRKVEGA